MQAQWQQMIADAFQNRELLKEQTYQDAVRTVIEEVDKGRLRVAEPTENGWLVNQWVKQANMDGRAFRVLR
jgi:2,3,4,5-tetrahydropyridine-2-carboxylate N-succinyltransferase